MVRTTYRLLCHHQQIHCADLHAFYVACISVVINNIIKDTFYSSMKVKLAPHQIALVPEARFTHSV